MKLRLVRFWEVMIPIPLLCDKSPRKCTDSQIPAQLGAQLLAPRCVGAARHQGPGESEGRPEGGEEEEEVGESVHEVVAEELEHDTAHEVVGNFEGRHGPIAS